MSGTQAAGEFSGCRGFLSVTDLTTVCVCHDIESVTDIDSRKTVCCPCALCIVAMSRRTSNSSRGPTVTPLKKQKDDSGGAIRSNKIYGGAGPTVFYVPVIQEAWLTIRQD